MRVMRLEEGRLVTGGPELARPGALTWIDAAPTPEDIALVGAKFAFHPLALEDAAHQDQRPKLEQYGPGMLIAVLHRLQPAPDESDVLALEIDALLTPEALVTFHAAQREVFAGLARPGQTVVKDQNAVYFRDVLDHSVRLTDEIDTGRDLLASAMDAYLSYNNNRLSAVTARLTVVASIFLPLNFIAGFFGMNLEIIHPSVAVPVVVASVVAFPTAMYFFFKRRRLL